MGGKQKFLKGAPACLAMAVLLLAWGLSLPARGQEVLKTRHAVVQAQSAADLMEMERRLHVATPAAASQTHFTGEHAFHPAFPRLAAKIDGILDRASRLLNLHPSRSSRLNIVLLTNGKAVRGRHLLLVPGQRPGLFGYGSLEAFYEARSRTIYLSLADLHEGILAHEMAHYLFCTTLAVPPPEYIQEAWAQYVESRW